MADLILPRRLHTIGDDKHAFESSRTEATDDAEAVDPEAERKTTVHTEALRRFRITSEAESAQRARELEDLQFDRALLEDHWPEDMRKARAASVGEDGVAVTAKPCLVITKLDQPIQQTLNEGKQARLGIAIKAKSNGANEDGADVRRGLIRAIEVDSNASQARHWAFDRAVKCGRGFYRVLKTYANDGDNDLDLVVKRNLNQISVYFDPFAQEPDWSDAEWCFITEDLPKEEYKRRYKTSALATASTDALQGLGDVPPGWIDTETFRVAEYYYVEHEKRTRVFDPQLGPLWLDEMGEDAAKAIPDTVKRREVDVRTVKWCVINAMEILDEEEWEGRYIPVVPVIGKEYNINGQRCFKGIVSNAKDAQRSYNVMRSAQVEGIALANRNQYLMFEGQDEGHEAMWDQANVRAYSRLYVTPVVGPDGAVLPLPQRSVYEPAIQAITLAVREAQNDIEATTGRHAPSLGALDPNQRSGKAIRELKAQAETGSSNYLDNLATVSMALEGRILLDLLKYVYDRPGRIARVLGEEEGDERHVMLNAPYIDGPDGVPQPITSEQPQPPGMMSRVMGAVGNMMGRPGQPQQPPKPPKHYDLSKGDYTVVVSVGRSTQTQREENIQIIQSLNETAPQLTAFTADLLAEQLDGPMGPRLAERLRKMNPALAHEEEENPIPPAVQQQIQGMQQQVQQLSQALQATTAQLKSEDAKLQMEAAIKREEIDSREMVDLARIRADLSKAQQAVQSKEDIARMQIAEKLLEARMEQAHERTMAARAEQAGHREAMRDHAMGRQSSDEDRQFQAHQAERGRAHESQEGAASRAHESEQADRKELEA